MKNKRKLTLLLLAAMLLTMLLGTTASAKSSTAATIGSEKYTSLEAALKKVKNGQTIVLKKNVTYTKPLTISRNVTFTLNLNKKTITFKNTGKSSNSIGLKISKGNVTIKNGTLKESNADSTLLYVNKNASVTIASGTYTGPVTNLGKLTITKGTFKTTAAMEKSKAGNFLITNRGTLTVNGGTFTTKRLYLLGNGGSSAELTVNGGTFRQTRTYNSDIEKPETSNGSMIYNYQINAKGGAVIINGGKFTSGVPVLLASCGTVHVQKGTLTAKEGATMALTGNAKATVSGGTWSISSCWANILLRDKSRVEVSSGTFKSECTSVESYDNSTCKISNGKFTTTLTDTENVAMLYLTGRSKITVTGGTFTGKKTCAYTKDPDATIKISGAKFNVLEMKATNSN